MSALKAIFFALKEEWKDIVPNLHFRIAMGSKDNFYAEFEQIFFFTYSLIMVK
jgi:hypothetical protein